MFFLRYTLLLFCLFVTNSSERKRVLSLLPPGMIDYERAMAKKKRKLFQNLFGLLPKRGPVVHYHLLDSVLFSCVPEPSFEGPRQTGSWEISETDGARVYFFFPKWEQLPSGGSKASHVHWRIIPAILLLRRMQPAVCTSHRLGPVNWCCFIIWNLWCPGRFLLWPVPVSRPHVMHMIHMIIWDGYSPASRMKNI